VALIVVTLGAVSAVRGQAPQTFSGRLSPVPITVAQVRAVTGTGQATASLKAQTLSISGTFQGLSSPATVARLYLGLKPGVRGPAVFDLQITKATTGTFSGTVQLTAAQVEDLARERFYVQIDSEKAPEGNLWGWLLVQETRQ
jgi:hypothetical protein